nr:hypothetical protein [Ferrimicrobium acidiphilum]
MTFVVLEGFSGTGKTTIANALEQLGWMHLTESAHAISADIPLADRGDVYSDYSLMGATLKTCGVIANNRARRNIVSEGFLVNDLTYSLIRQKRGQSDAAAEFFSIVGNVLRRPALKPDLYAILMADEKAIMKRQKLKSDRDRLTNKFFRKTFYQTLNDLHELFGHKNTLVVKTDSGKDAAVKEILKAISRR